MGWGNFSSPNIYTKHEFVTTERIRENSSCLANKVQIGGTITDRFWIRGAGPIDAFLEGVT
jgi:hypothetical protein